MILELSLESLRDGHTVITVDGAGYFIENCKVCFHSQNHQSGVAVHVDYDDKPSVYRVTWQDEITESMLRAWLREDRRNTEIAAIALTMLLLPNVTSYRAVESAGYGTGMDYILIDKAVDDDMLIFNGAAAYLEVTGIAKATETNTTRERIAEKKARILKVRAKDATILGGLPTLIACVEFSTPLIRIETYE
jgi:uncharacterized protein YpmB